MTIKKHGAAAWQGGIKDGKGSISTESGALSEYPLKVKRVVTPRS
jgi:osmotically inducible protein OsmC